MALTAYHAGKQQPKEPEPNQEPRPATQLPPVTKPALQPQTTPKSVPQPQPTGQASSIAPGFTKRPIEPPTGPLRGSRPNRNRPDRFQRNNRRDDRRHQGRPASDTSNQPQTGPRSMFQTVQHGAMPKIERPRPPKRRMEQKAETPGILLKAALDTPVNRTYQAGPKKLRVIPLGGLGEIGKNMTAIEYGDDIIVVDCGVMFPTEEMLGIDAVIPDVTYLVENRHKLRGMLFTHGHEDHISGIGYVLPRLGHIPMYGLPLTASFIEGKLSEFDNEYAREKVNRIKTGQVLKFGVFTVEAFAITHSIPDSVGFAIDTPEGLVILTGDWKFDHTPIWGEPTNFGKLMEYAQKGVLLLMSDSTNASEEGYTISERVIGEKLDQIFDVKTGGRIIVSCFSSLLNRIQMVVNSSASHGRKVALLGRSMEDKVRRAHELGYFNAPKDVLVDRREIGKYPDNKLTIICTGSQGEEYSALVRMASAEHRDVQLRTGDTVVISASEIPGNEHAIHATIDNLFRQGADVIHGRELDTHTSGHGKAEELKMLLSLLKPKFFVPYHGDYRFLKAHAKLAIAAGVDPKNIFVAENGSVIEVKDGKGSWGDRVPGGYVFVDGLGIGDIGQIVLRDRQAMAEEGIFMVIITISKQTGELIGSPDIISRGFVYMRAAETLMAKARGEIKNIFTKHAKEKGAMDWEYVKRAIRDDLGEFLYEHTQRQPMVIPVIIEV